MRCNSYLYLSIPLFRDPRNRNPEFDTSGIYFRPAGSCAEEKFPGERERDAEAPTPGSWRPLLRYLPLGLVCCGARGTTAVPVLVPPGWVVHWPRVIRCG